jgi:DNA-binding XRE family transcriptional regulator
MSRRSELVRRRKTAGFSQERLAYALEVDRSTIARWESGDATPLATFRPKLATLLKVSAEELESILQDRATPDASNPVTATRPAKLVISGSRAPGCDPQVLDDTVAALARLIAVSGATVNHGPVGIGIEVVTYVADQFRPAGFSMSAARFGRENVVHGADLMIVIGGASGTAAEVTIAQALGMPVLPFRPTGGTAARTLEALVDAGQSSGGYLAELVTCTTPTQFTALVERTMNEIGTHL